MARVARAPSVTLPSFPWVTHGQAGVDDEGNPIMAPLANGVLAQDDIDEDAEPGPDGELRRRKVRVWRTARPATLEGLTPIARLAMHDYGGLVEAVGSSTGTLDPSGGGGSVGGARSPSLGRMAAAEKLRRIDTTLGAQFVVIRSPNRKMPSARLTMRDVALAVAVDHATADAILAMAGVGKPTNAWRAAALLAVAKTADSLVECCGLRQRH